MLKWGILGTAKINLKTIPAIKRLPNQIIVGLASRTPQKAHEFCKHFAIEKVYESYDQLITSKEIDAVYISLPNDQHYEWSKKCLQNGKHVLCEKPMVLNAENALELTALARENGLMLMEGYMYRHHRQIQIIQNLIKANKIGTIQNVRISFHYTIPKEQQNIRLNASNGGGALWDIGCYCVDLANLLFSSMPKTVFATANFEGGVDRAFSGLMVYDSGKSAQFDCSFQGVRRDALEIVGTTGVIQLNHPFKGSVHESIQIILNDGVEQVEVYDEIDTYTAEFDNFYDCIKGTAKPIMTNQDSIATIKTIEALLHSAKNDVLTFVK
jgi:predicted dehydrogenase